MEPKPIKKLDEAVVNRIAAGEIIQRPANAIKELMENCIDAKSTQIHITVKTGGLKLLQIQDNGTGIRKEDLEIVCERFTTSKLENFEDLSSIKSYGFRGEALASISHVAHLTIQTKTLNAACGYKASYSDGKLKESPRPCAGNQGTIISVEDLFYNVPQRKQALKTPNDEYQKIYEVVCKYAVHNSHIGFLLKKSGEKNAIRTSGNSDRMENIRLIYGNQVTKDLIQTELDDRDLRFKMFGCFTNGNFNTMKKGIFVLFINHRLVESQSLKFAIDNIYSTILPRGIHPFIYINLEIDPMNVDVNVHPTKYEVHFLHEETIIEKIKSEIEQKLLQGKDSRTYYTQSRLPFENEPPKAKEDLDESTEKSVYAKDMIRICSKSQKIEKFITPSQNISNNNLSQTQILDLTADEDTFSRKETQLTSILTIRKEIEENCNRDLRQILMDSSYIGAIDKDQILIQSGTKMYLCNAENMSKELFYQVLMFEFENFGQIDLEEPLSLKELALIGLESERSGWTPEDGPREDLAERIVQILCEKAPLLKAYYGIVINPELQTLETISLLIENHQPAMVNLPNYLLRITTEVDWDSEKEFFQTFSRETANFYSEIPFSQSEEEWKHSMEHVLYPAFKNFLLPPNEFAKNSTFLELASLPNLYKVFERC